MCSLKKKEEKEEEQKGSACWCPCIDRYKHIVVYIGPYGDGIIDARNA